MTKLLTSLSKKKGFQLFYFYFFTKHDFSKYFIQIFTKSKFSIISFNNPYIASFTSFIYFGNLKCVYLGLLIVYILDSYYF